MLGIVEVDGGTAEESWADHGGDDSRQPSIEKQTLYWNSFNTSREQVQGEVSHRQARVVADWLCRLGRDDLHILEVGCGGGWLAPTLLPFGEVTANDLADEVLDRAAKRHPEVTFVPGDVMDIALDPGSFDVVVSLEVLSHVENQAEFVDRLATLIRPGGQLMLATQNRPVLTKYNDIPPAEEGQLRRWVDADELGALLEPAYHVLELFSVTPVSNRGFMRVVNSRKVSAPIRVVVGDRLDRLKERMGLGWTLMCLAERKTDALLGDRSAV